MFQHLVRGPCPELEPTIYIVTRSPGPQVVWGAAEAFCDVEKHCLVGVVSEAASETRALAL